MSMKTIVFVALASLGSVVLLCAMRQAQAEPSKAHYLAIAHVDQYLMPDKSSEIALARSAAPPSISDASEVMVLGRHGYTAAVKGRNGFTCLVYRSWGAPINDPVFWNPKVRAPVCFNLEASRSFLPIYLMKTRLVLAGKSEVQLVHALAAAFSHEELPTLEPGAMALMTSQQQYMTDQPPHNYRPHLMFFIPGDLVTSWGANLQDAPVMGAYRPEDRATIFFVFVDRWSDGMLAPGTSVRTDGR